jgi:ABC-type transporter Mla subunit MlaD
MNIHVYLHDGPHDLEHRLDRLEKVVRELFHQGERIMATLADLQAAVTAEDTVIDSAITLLQGLAAQIAALQPNQAAIDALAADVTAKTQALADAVTANTPAAP